MSTTLFDRPIRNLSFKNDERPAPLLRPTLVVVDEPSVRHDDESDAAPRIGWRTVALEREIEAAILSAPGPGERIEFAFRRKEQELKDLFARLPVLDAMELHRRLNLCLNDDPLANQFKRLISERRARLITFLADARRREATRRVA